MVSLTDTAKLATLQPCSEFHAAVMFCDIRGFTRLLEHVEPNAAFKFIEDFFRTLSKAVLAEGGTINNLTGDGFLAQFGIGLNNACPETRAVNCAISIRAELSKLNQFRHFTAQPTFTVGIGIHSGKIAGGPIRLGSLSAFVLVGDTINFASRIESLTKDFSVDVLLSEEAHAKISAQFKCQAMPAHKVRGRTEKVTSYWLLPLAKVARNYETEMES
jgi:adenylate cyclase